MADNDPFEQLVRYASARWLTTYVECGEGAAVWAAYLEWRNSGVPVPENILAKFDEWANAVLAARNGAEAAEALNLGPSGRSGTFRQRIEAAAKNVDAMRYLSGNDVLPIVERKKRAAVDFGRSRKTIEELAVRVGLTRGKRGRPKKHEK
ncbi:hypothetical protein [Burkholderia ubonensis]|uniref:hypothetical protein n=1 Tax=Burkholderia ubonensis TaxID=101571 RepID=UPI0012F93AE6|nr:hypothetical protein [Burkholderia ubonensis]